MGQFGTFGGGQGGGGGFQGGPDPFVAQQLAGLANEFNSAINAQTFLLADARRRLCRLEAQVALRVAGREPKYPVEFRSQFGEDALMWSIFDGKLDGFFIEVGAFDGYYYSTTYGFESVGWKGLLIEAIPERAAQCAARRKHARVVNAALGKKGSTGTATFTVVADRFGGMLSFHTTDAAHMDSLRRGQFLRSTVSVPLTTMDALLETTPTESGGPPVVDFASIDVEGGEPDLLDGFDVARWKPTVLLIEDNTRGASAPAREMFAKLGRLGYQHLGWLAVNALLVRTDVPDVFERAKTVMLS